MSHVLFPILSGSLAYSIAQFIWYSPFWFGPAWRRTQGVSSESVYQAAVAPGWVGRIVAGIIVPALLTSLALVVLERMLDRSLPGAGVFIAASLVLVVSVSAPKYIRAAISQHWPDAAVRLQDGALWFGVMAAAVAIVLSANLKSNF